ncbi:MAG TPA: hypothetical protein VGI73_13450 [Solirubrobacterales bacterium]|jgi:hypothetical protein
MPMLVLLAAGALAGCGGSSASDSGPDTTAAPASTPPQLEAAIAKAAASGVPVRIPPPLLESPPPGADHAEVLRSPADSYTLALTAKPGCRFKSSCVVAVFSGSAAADAQLGGEKLQLAEGIEGVYEPGRCGPGCKLGTVAWRQGGDTYGVAVPNASSRELVVLANEAIEAKPVAEARK